jgi:sphingolipid delta-4 desaturase
MAVEDYEKFEVSPQDGRGPLILGNWTRSIPNVHKDFARDDRDDPHIKRKLNILKAHPEVQHLEGSDQWSIPITLLAVGINLLIAYHWARVWEFSLVPFLLTVYFIGGTMTNIIGVIMHEATHNSMHPSLTVNKIMLFVANMTIPVPVGAAFRRYHFEHHTYQGVEGKDPDLPMKWEISLIRGSTWRKLLFLTIYPFMYAIRAAAFGKRFSTLEVYNSAFIICWDLLIWRVWGLKALAYLLGSLWIGYSFHPAAAHFIQEHYTFASKQETYSYYGPLNWVFLNIGYHNEHHDFPKIPWSRLPLVKAIASEFYEPLMAFDSWYWVLYSFVTDNAIGPQSRCVRDIGTYKAARKFIQKVKGVSS